MQLQTLITPTMVIDSASYYQFAVDDLEANMSHVSFQDLASDRAGFKLRDTYDAEVLGYMSGWKTPTAWARNTTTNGTKQNAAAGSDEILAGNKLDITDFGGSDIGGTGEVTSIPIAAGGGAGQAQRQGQEGRRPPWSPTGEG